MQGDHVITCGADKTVRVWEVADGGHLVHTLAGHSDEVFACLPSYDGHILVSGMGFFLSLSTCVRRAHTALLNTPGTGSKDNTVCIWK
jgi:WD40 repeat protein